jgi:hypothetical protein
MSLLIPAIEWGDFTLVGDTTSGNAIITNVANTSSVVAGMKVTGTGIPSGAEVVSKTSNSITINLNASANGTAVTLTLFRRFEFTYPPREDSEDDIRAQVRRVKSLSGIEQTQTEFVEAIRNLTFDFITSSDRDTLLNEFMLKWAIIGKPFRYFDDKAVSTSKVYTNDRFDFDQNRTVKKHPSFLYRIPFRFRRVVSFGS